MIHYCTYFDRNYLTRALALHQSLIRHSPPFVLWALCFDDDAFGAVTALGLEGLRAVSLTEFERSDPELLAVKPTRSTVEYYFTSTPSLVLFVMNQLTSPGIVTYLDADLLFYSSPQPLFDELGIGSVLIIPHRFPEQLRHLEIYGTFNVGLLAFRNDSRGRSVLERWRQQCIEWCYDRYDNGRFADQGYLNDWPSLPGVVISDHPGAGLAPWNFMQYRMDLSRDPFTVDGEPLIFFHFQGFKSVGPGLFDLGLEDYGMMDRGLRRRLYGRYVRALRQADVLLRLRAPSFSVRASSIRGGPTSLRRLIRKVVQGEILISPAATREPSEHSVPDPMEAPVGSRGSRFISSASPYRRLIRVIVPASVRHLIRTFVPKLRLLRFYHAFRRAPLESANYLLFNREIDNFTYELRNEMELAQFLGTVLGISVDEAAGYIDELQGNDALRVDIREHLAFRADRNRTMPYGRRLGWYAVARARKPQTIVETGVHDGLGSTVLLEALRRNAADGFDGRLVSFDINPDAGWLIPNQLKGRHEIHIGNSLDLLTPALNGREVGLFIHDSDHRYAHEAAEFETVRTLARQGAVLISDNAHAGSAFKDFCQRYGLPYHLFMEVPANHFYPGAGIGLTVMGPA